MSSSSPPRTGAGPFQSHHIRSGDAYELSNGHPIYCAPTGRDGTEANGLGYAVLSTDPAVQRAGVDTGLALGRNTLRAPDIAVNFEGAQGAWATSAPLVVEYAGQGQDEAELRAKIVELHAAGTRHVWVVRLVGTPRVEVHDKGAPVRTAVPGQMLTAPGVLHNPVRVEALFDREAAHETALANLLQRKGYSDLDAVRAEGREEGRDAGRDEGREEALQLALKTALTARGWTLDAEQSSRVAACHDVATLTRWIARAVTAPRCDDVFLDP